MSDSGFHWGWRIGIVYALFAGGIISFVLFALTQDVGLVREDFYEYGLQYEQRMDAQRNANSLGAEAGITLEDNTFKIRVPVSHVSDYVGTVLFFRPNDNTKDRKLDLVFDSKGAMTLSTSEFHSGKWLVTATWKFDGKVYEIEKDFEL